MVHTTESTRLPAILNQKRLLATECNVFRGERLCYLFVGRPSYKYEMQGEAAYWMLPTVFVVRFQDQPIFKRVYPFDSGAFSRRKLPDYITTFSLDDFEFGPDIGRASTLVEAYFGSVQKYWRRQPSSEADFRSRHGCGPLHMQIEALNRLYGDRSNDYDDRAACIEAQFDKDVPIGNANVLGVVIPEEFLRDASVKSELRALTPNIETYDIQPVNLVMYFGLIYQCVQRIYNKFGLLNE